MCKPHVGDKVYSLETHDDAIVHILFEKWKGMYFIKDTSGMNYWIRREGNVWVAICKMNME